MACNSTSASCLISDLQAFTKTNLVKTGLLLAARTKRGISPHHVICYAVHPRHQARACEDMGANKAEASASESLDGLRSAVVCCYNPCRV